MSELKIGETLVYEGRTFVLRGLTPRGVVPSRVWLQDTASGDTIEAPCEEVRHLRERDA